jgi:hypothetical protein
MNGNPHAPETLAPPHVTLRVQTPRGLWSTTEPKDAAKRPVYTIPTKVQQVIDDSRLVFGFVEEENAYTLLRGKEKLDPNRPLASYQLTENELLVLSVKGGNA